MNTPLKSFRPIAPANVGGKGKRHLMSVGLSKELGDWVIAQTHIEQVVASVIIRRAIANERKRVESEGLI